MSTSTITEHLPAETAPPADLGTTEPDNSPPKRGAGRPPNPRPAQAGAHTPQESPQSEQLAFWQFVSEIPEAAWEIHLMYLYRWQPFYDMTKGGIEPKYVCLYTAAVTIDDIKKAHGSGRYNLKLNRKEPNTRSDKTIKQLVFDILDPAFPPNLPPGDWQTDPRNKQWAWGKAPAGEAAQGNQGGGIGTSIRDIKDLVQSIYPDIGKNKADGVTAEVVKILPELIRERNNTGAPALDPLAMITQIVSLMKIMQPAPPPPPPPADNSMQAFLLAQLQRSEDRANAMQTQFLTLIQQRNDPPKPPDMLESMDKIVNLVSKVADAREALGGGGGSRMNGWQEAFSNVGTELIRHVGPALPLLMAPKPQQRPAPVVRPAVAAALPNAGAPAQATATAAAPVPDPGAAAETIPEVLEEESAEMTTARFIASNMQRAGLVAPLLTYFSDGEDGLDFARWVVDGHGAMPLNAIKGQGKETLLRAITTCMPELYEQLKPNWAGFEVFVDQFLSWTPENHKRDEEDEDEEPEPLTATPAATPAGTPPGTPAGTAPGIPPGTPHAPANAPPLKPARKTTKPAGACQLAKPGWYCTRTAGHDGPCAAKKAKKGAGAK